MSILQPAEGDSSALDGAVGVPHLSGSVLGTARDAMGAAPPEAAQEPVRSSIMVRREARSRRHEGG